MVYMLIPTTNLVCVLFDPVIPTSSFNLFYTCLLYFFVNDNILLPMLNALPVRYRDHVYDVTSLCARMLM